MFPWRRANKARAQPQGGFTARATACKEVRLPNAALHAGWAMGEVEGSEA